MLWFGLRARIRELEAKHVELLDHIADGAERDAKLAQMIGDLAVKVHQTRAGLAELPAGMSMPDFLNRLRAAGGRKWENSPTTHGKNPQTDMMLTSKNGDGIENTPRGIPSNASRNGLESCESDSSEE